MCQHCVAALRSHVFLFVLVLLPVCLACPAEAEELGTPYLAVSVSVSVLVSVLVSVCLLGRVLLDGM